MFEFFITNFLLLFWPSLTPRHDKSFLAVHSCTRENPARGYAENARRSKVSLQVALEQGRSRRNAARARLVRANAQSDRQPRCRTNRIATRTICHFLRSLHRLPPGFQHPGRQWRRVASSLKKSFTDSRSPRQKVVRSRLVRDGFTDRASDFASRAEMNAAPDAGKPHFDGGVGEALIGHRHARQGGRTQREGRLVTQK